MAKNRKGTISMLLDLHYRLSANEFEEFYGYSVSYSEVEQVSYIDLKEMCFEMINRDIKFRKFGRIGRVLTVKMDILPEEYETFLNILNEKEVDEDFTHDLVKNPSGKVKYKKFRFLHDFTISNVRELTNEERKRFKKSLVDESSEIEIEESE